MPEIKGIAHFSIPVSDVDRSTKFYTEIVGCKFLSQRPDKVITFLDAGGVCLLLIKRPAPITRARSICRTACTTLSWSTRRNTRPRWTACARRVSKSSSRKTGAAQSTDRVPISAIRTARHWSSSIARHTSSAGERAQGASIGAAKRLLPTIGLCLPERVGKHIAF